ncbi:MAG: amino acid permease [Candidatus Omnitrophica bacterium]|nr:amino acid permease [Candidatus Omnitrophota bacterium]
MNHFAPGQLKRSLGAIALIAYGVGDILGAGIYALVGKVIGIMGPASWLSFVAAFIVASLTGLAYAELGSRMPRAGGAAVFALEAFKKPAFSYLIGLLVLLSGVVSMATVSHGFSGYLQVLFPRIPVFAIIFFFFLVLGVINFLGMKESSLTNIICTLVEVVGLVIVIAAGFKFFGKEDYFSIHPPQGVYPASALLQGGILAFYAFVGFEDLVNVAEEVKSPEKNMPRAIVIALVVTAAIYILTAVAAVSAVPISELSSSGAPLVLVVEKGFPGLPPGLFTLIALFAVTNTALINFIMSSRILYGMAREGLVPSSLGEVHEKRGTPLKAICAVFVLAVALAFTGSLVVLAQSTSFLLLSVFLVMNISLIVIKLRTREKPSFQVPFWIPVFGGLTCLILMFYVKKEALLTVLGLLILGLLFYRLQMALVKRKIF